MSSWADDLWGHLVGDRRAISASAPGKVLLTGGYLILDSRYSGLVIAVNARFTTKVALLSPDSSSSQNDFQTDPQIILIAPQYSEQPLTSSLALDSISFSPRPNSFIEHVIKYVLAVARECVPNLASILRSGVVIYARADPAFYSAIGADGVARSKSGLGSSAALVSSVTAALLALFDINDREIAYRTAQLAHCAAQGKVGSGFDVSAAFFGSQIYRRFNEDAIREYLNPAGPFPRPLVGCLRDDDAWHHQHAPVIIPEGLGVVLGDVRQGSQTPGMVKTVLEWRQAQGPDCWDDLGRLNDSFVATLNELRDCPVSAFDQAAQVAHDQWHLCGRAGVALSRLREIFVQIRSKLREIGKESGVEIEPALQEDLLDVTMDEQGVVCAGVPGAGGFDAVFAIYVGGESTCHRIQRLWSLRNVDLVNVELDSHGIVVSK